MLTIFSRFISLRTTKWRKFNKIGPQLCKNYKTYGKKNASSPILRRRLLDYSFLFFIFNQTSTFIFKQNNLCFILNLEIFSYLNTPYNCIIFNKKSGYCLNNFKYNQSNIIFDIEFSAKNYSWLSSKHLKTF